MKRIWLSSMGLSLGLLAGQGSAQEVAVRLAPPRPALVQASTEFAVAAPAVTPARTVSPEGAPEGTSSFATLRPVTPSPKAPAATHAWSPAASLDRPVPLSTPAPVKQDVVDPQLQPASFMNAPGSLRDRLGLGRSSITP